MSWSNVVVASVEGYSKLPSRLSYVDTGETRELVIDVHTGPNSMGDDNVPGFSYRVAYLGPAPSSVRRVRHDAHHDRRHA